METAEQISYLPQLLVPWYAANKRELPWRKDREPYHVWLSEIMLQQTRVQAVINYYKRFLAAYPDLKSLANAEPEKLNKLWEGLGYYSRVRNMQAAAKQIMSTYGGKFPDSYEELQTLKGIGAYTAGAIASICFEQPTPAVDGNVLRVIARVCADTRPINEEKTKTAVREALSAVYPKGQCGDFTQSLMELGATICVPNGAPNCTQCPLNQICKSMTGGWRTYPVKAQKKPRKVEEKTVYILECDGAIAVSKRKETGLLAGLWELPNTEGILSVEDALQQAEAWKVHPTQIIKTVERTHIFTHVEWRMYGVYIRCRTRAARFSWADARQRKEQFALPTAFRLFL